jgi:hypothetical protein
MNSFGAVPDFSDTRLKSQTVCFDAGPNSINLFFEFYEVPLKDKYRKFKIASTSPRYTLFIASLITAGFSFYWGMMLSVYSSILPLCLFAFSFLFAILLMWLIVYLRYRLPISQQQDRYRVFLGLLESVTMVGLVITTALVVIMRSQKSHCTMHTFSNVWDCYPDSSSYAVLGDVSFILICFPFILSVGFPFVPYIIVMLCLLVGTVFVLTLFSYLNILSSMSFLIVAILFNIFLLVFARLQSMELFLYLIKYYRMVEERSDYEKQLTQKLNDEMRNLIASISHDIKSVSSLFPVLIIDFDGFFVSFLAFYSSLSLLLSMVSKVLKIVYLILLTFS